MAQPPKIIARQLGPSRDVSHNELTLCSNSSNCANCFLSKRIDSSTYARFRWSGLTDSKNLARSKLRGYFHYGNLYFVSFLVHHRTAPMKSEMHYTCQQVLRSCKFGLLSFLALAAIGCSSHSNPAKQEVSWFLDRCRPYLARPMLAPWHLCLLSKQLIQEPGCRSTRSKDLSG
jgi:hypothetical protein